jgi:hypothetical protein
MLIRLDCLNEKGQADCLGRRNDFPGVASYHYRMPAPRHDWYLKQWLKHFGKKQADVERDLEWNKSRVSLMARGMQPYDRDSVNEIAAYLNIEPYELLMHPDAANAYKQFLVQADRVSKTGEQLRIVADRTGTEG